MLSEIDRTHAKLNAMIEYMGLALDRLHSEHENAASEIKEAAWEVILLCDEAKKFFQGQKPGEKAGVEMFPGEGGPVASGDGEACGAQKLVTQPTPASA